MADLVFTIEQARAVAIAAQGLDRSLGGVGGVLEQAGLVRTLGGIEAYLALCARDAEITPGAVHAAVESRAACVVPAARGCMYLVPARDVAACLVLADSLSSGRAAREHERAGIQPGEVEALGARVAQALAASPLTTDELRKALPEGSVRSLGEQGRKIGISSPLPAALRRLEMDGRIERSPEQHRLDNERYRWRLIGARAIEKPSVEQALRRLAEGYFRAAGLGTVRNFADWAGVSLRDAQLAVDHLDTVAVRVEGLAAVHHALRDVDALVERETGMQRTVALLGFEDNLLALHGRPAALVAPQFHGMEVPSWGSNTRSRLGEARHLSHRPVVAEGRVVGFWEHDPDTQSVVVGFFERVSMASRERVREHAATIEGLVRELGHAHSFSLDTDEDMRKRAAWVRELAPG